MLLLPTPPGMNTAGTGLKSGASGNQNEVVELVLRLRDERRGNLILVKRIKDLENVVHEQERTLRVTEGRIPKTALEWGAAALEALNSQEAQENCENMASLELLAKRMGSRNADNDTHAHTHTSPAPQGPPPVVGPDIIKPNEPNAHPQTHNHTSSVSPGQDRKPYSDANCQTVGFDYGQTRGAEEGTTAQDSVMTAQDSLEREQTQAAKISALQYKVSSLTEETELLRQAADERDRKNKLHIRELADQLQDQDKLVTRLSEVLEEKEQHVLQLHEALQQKENDCGELLHRAELTKIDHGTMVSNLLAAMEEAKQVSDDTLQSQNDNHALVIESLRLEAENYRQFFVQHHPQWGRDATGISYIGLCECECECVCVWCVCVCVRVSIRVMEAKCCLV
jgi:hypothetical protein